MPARLFAALVLVASVTTRLGAQEPPQASPGQRGSGWLTGYALQMGIEKLSGDDTRFQWDFDVGGEVDLIRAGAVRVNLLVNYEAVLGEQLQRFDPIFNNYTIDLSGGATRGEIEWTLRFHHVSRHLGDREKRFGIAWNMLGPQVNWRRTRPALDLQVRGWALGTVAWYSVDYAAELGADAYVERPLDSRFSLVGRGYVHGYLVDQERSGRGAQAGARVEAALRLRGPGAAAELYAAVDRRVDADPLEQQPVTWGLIGLRFLGN